jgi:hypothetical protein
MATSDRLWYGFAWDEMWDEPNVRSNASHIGNQNAGVCAHLFVCSPGTHQLEAWFMSPKEMLNAEC